MIGSIAKSRVKNICRRWTGQFTDFSSMIALEDFLTSTVLRKSNSKLKHEINNNYYNRAKEIVHNKYGRVIEKWDKDVQFLELIAQDSPLFIFWWQGFDKAPATVKACVSSIKEHAGNHKIVALNKDNWKDYISLPEKIEYLILSEKINKTVFSDILRYCLLYQYGGFWIDPTCFMTKDFSKEIYTKSFYTIKHGDSWEHPICKGMWSTFFFASGKQNPLFGYMRDITIEYWTNETNLIVYLLPDVFLSIAYDKLSYAKKMIDEVPLNNIHRVDLLKALDKNNGKGFDRLLNEISDTYIHKLTYKTYIEKFDDLGR